MASSKKVSWQDQQPHGIKVTYTDEEPEIVYLTEKGCDLYKIWPDIGAIDSALKGGYSWYDLMYSDHGYVRRHVKARRVKVVVTTEAAIADIRAAEAKAKAEAEEKVRAAAEAREKAAADAKAAADEACISHNLAKINAIIRGMNHYERTFDALVDMIVDVLQDVPAEHRLTVGNRASEIIVRDELLYKEESVCDQSDASTMTYTIDEQLPPLPESPSLSGFQTPFSTYSQSQSGYVTPISMDDFPAPAIIDDVVYLPAVTSDKTQYLLPIIPLDGRSYAKPIQITPPRTDPWYVLSPKGFRQGPYTEMQMRAWYAAGKIREETKVRKGRNGGFRGLSSLWGGTSPFCDHR